MGVLVRTRKGKTGVWVIASHHCQRSYKRFEDKSAANKYAKALETNLGLIGLNKGGVLLQDYFIQWLTSHAQLHLKPSTFDQYKIGYERYIKPVLGSRPIASITRSDVRNLLAAMAADNKSKATMKAYLAPLSACLNRAIEDELIVRNPCFRILPRARGAGQSKVGKALSAEDLNQLLTICRRDFPSHYPFILTLARTGMRVGEVQALCWKEVDFSSHCILVRRTYRSNKHVQDTAADYSPKSGRSRDVPMSEELERELRIGYAARRPEWPLVFPSERGSAKDLPNFRKRAWQTILSHAGVKIRLHDLRHTFASLLLNAGISIAVVQKILGHHSIKVTVDLYGHLESGRYRDAVNVLDQGSQGSQGSGRTAD